MSTKKTVLNTAHKLNWSNSRPVEYYPKCIELFGQPNAVSPAKHGFAIWKTKGLFDEHILRDEDVKHCVPRPHHDYFYSSVKFYIPDNKVWDVLKISGSINYDGLKKLLTARCGGIGANYATLYLGMCVANGKLDIGEVKQADMYPRMIRGEIIPHEELHKIMYKMKQENNAKYKRELGLQYATYAYKECYSEKQTKKQQGNTSISSSTTELKNTRNEKCSHNNWTACCPHMPPNEKGQYIATNETTILYYRRHEYELHTCCKHCSEEMNKLSKRNPALFAKKYIHSFDADGNLIAKNQHDRLNRPVQILKLKK